MKPLAIDLFCGLGGWTEGLLEEGYEVIGFDIVQHVYGEHRYPAQLVIQDVLTLHGSQFKDAALIVASPPCQEYSYMAMPWKIAKQRAAEYRSGARDVEDLNRLFNACFRIQREASAAKGACVPMVVENVRGAQPWVGRSRWNYGSFHFWGDVPALMPMTWKRHRKVEHREDIRRGAKVTPRLKNPAEHFKQGGDWFSDSRPGTLRSFSGSSGRKMPGVKLREKGFNVAAAEQYGPMVQGANYERTDADKRSHIGVKRRMASAMIAKIPLPISRHIGRVYSQSMEDSK